MITFGTAEILVASTIAQWAAIAVLAFMVFGLTRQLGHFLLPHHEQLRDHGPGVGTELDRRILDEATRSAVTNLFAAHDVDSATVVAIDANCTGCRQLLAELERYSRAQYKRTTVLVALVRTSPPEFVDRARATCDLVVEDLAGERFRHAGIIVTPYVLCLDRDLRVARIEVGKFIHSDISTWFTATATSKPLEDLAPENNSSDKEMVNHA